MGKYKILLIEDDLGLAITLKDFFEDNGLDVIHTADGGCGVQLYEAETPDLVLLDIMLPNKTGFEIIETIRSVDYLIPIILMTGTEISPDKELKGYELGAVNYMKKPVLPQIILAQIKNILSIPKNSKHYKIGGYRIEIQNQKIQIDDAVLKLRDKDILVLTILLDQQNQIVSREAIFKYTWNDNRPERNNMLDGVVLRLRKVLKEYDKIQIKSVYGSGYILETEK